MTGGAENNHTNGNEEKQENHVWYFGYGSNMSTAQLAAGKGVIPAESLPAKLEGWKLVFNLRAILQVMGSMANIVRQEGSVVHGMVHKLTQQQMKEIDQFEGEGHIYHRIPATVTTYDGRKIEASVYEVPPTSKWAGTDGRPALRYKNILLNGAKTANLDPDYIAFLESVEHSPFAYNKDRDRPMIPEKHFTREEVKESKDKVSFMGFVFDISHIDPYFKQMISARGPMEFAILRMMPSETQEKPKIPEKFTDFTQDQVAFLDTWLHAMETEWPILGTCPPPTTIDRC